jgi:tripartite-type tricarboxylate transporter receptor subunit TctC
MKSCNRISWRNRIAARALTLALSAWCAALSAESSDAQVYPARPIHIVVAEPGTQSDAMGRAIVPALTRMLGQPIVIDNQGGAGGTIAAQRVAQARADGYTLLIGGVNNVVLATLVRSNLSYAPATDLLPLGGIARVPYGIAITGKIPANDLTEFFAYARAHPGELSFGSSGTGSSSQLAIELLKARIGLDMLHVPYRGTTSALPDLIGGRIQVMASDLSLLLPQAKAGRVRLVAVTGAKRAEASPETPTVAEQGLPGYAIEPWYGLFAPAGIPKEVEDVLARTLGDALRSEEVIRQLLAQGYEPFPLSGDALRAFAAEETTKYSGLIDLAGLRNSQ